MYVSKWNGTFLEGDFIVCKLYTKELKFGKILI